MRCLRPGELELEVDALPPSEARSICAILQEPDRYIYIRPSRLPNSITQRTVWSSFRLLRLAPSKRSGLPFRLIRLFEEGSTYITYL